MCWKSRCRKKSEGGKYLHGKLSPSGCLTDNLYFVFLINLAKRVVLRYDLQPGVYVMEELNIIAAVETLQGNTISLNVNTILRLTTSLPFIICFRVLSW
jgi:hypothetical protein